MDLAFGDITKTSAESKITKSSSMYYSKRFLNLWVKIKYLILKFSCFSNFSLNSLLNCANFLPLLKIRWLCLCELISGVNILFHLLSLCLLTKGWIASSFGKMETVSLPTFHIVRIKGINNHKELWVGHGI
jgi:hypothetical protein